MNKKTKGSLNLYVNTRGGGGGNSLVKAYACIYPNYCCTFENGLFIYVGKKRKTQKIKFIYILYFGCCLRSFRTENRCP